MARVGGNLLFVDSAAEDGAQQAVGAGSESRFLVAELGVPDADAGRSDATESDVSGCRVDLFLEKGGVVLAGGRLEGPVS